MNKKNIHLLVLPSAQNIAGVVDKLSFDAILTKGSYKNIEFIFQKEGIRILHNGKDLKHFSFIWLSSFWGTRDLAYAVEMYLKKHTVPHTPVEQSTSKLTDQMTFSLNSIRTPDTLFIDPSSLENSLDLIGEICGYPCIVKDVRGSLGANSLLIQRKEDVLNALRKFPKHKKYFFQRFVPNDYDWGILVANGKVVSGEKSYPQSGEFRNNTCNGAKEVFVSPENIPKAVKDMAIKSAAALQLSWSRADIVVDKYTRLPYLMEVNRRPVLTTDSMETDGAYTFLSQQLKSFS